MVSVAPKKRVCAAFVSLVDNVLKAQKAGGGNDGVSSSIEPWAATKDFKSLRYVTVQLDSG